MALTQFLPIPNSACPLPSHEIDVELLTFVERYATNLIRWDVLVFFGVNPSAQDDAFGIAQQIGRAERAVQKELDDLVYLGILRADCYGENILYELTSSTATRRSVMRLARDFAARD